MKSLEPTEAQIRRIDELGATLKAGATRADAAELIERIRPPTEGVLRFFVDNGGIPFDGLTMVEAERLTEQLMDRPAETMAQLQQLYGHTPAHPYLLEWLVSFGFVLNGEISSGEAANVIQTTKNEVSYLGFENAFLCGDDEEAKNPVEKKMRELRKHSFPEWAYRKREMIDNHVRLLGARETALRPLIERHHSEAAGNLGAIAKTLEWERMVFWMAFTGVNMDPDETDWWVLGHDFGDLPELAEKLAKIVPPMNPATEAEVTALLAALDDEHLDWELRNPEQAFFEMRMMKLRQKDWSENLPPVESAKVRSSRMRPPRIDQS